MPIASFTMPDQIPAEPPYRANAHPDGWHDVRAPGGYEWWYFDADHADGDLHVVCIFMQGFIFHPGYLRRHFRQQRAPWRREPVLPGEYPCAYLVVYENGRIASQFMAQYAPEAFSAAINRPEVSIGPNHMRGDIGGGLRVEMAATPWRLTWRGPRLLEGLTLRAQLHFRPRCTAAPMQRTFLSRTMTGADHQWCIANPLCDVDGAIVLDGPGGRSWTIRGRGYHDHNYGTGPICPARGGQGLRDWIWGRMLLDDRVFTFHCARPRRSDLPIEAHLVEADAADMRELPVQSIDGDWRVGVPMGLAYPRRLRLGRALTIDSPRVVDASPFYLRVLYNGRCDFGGGKVLCEVAHPHRLRWPVLGRMIEMSIHRAPSSLPPGQEGAP